MNMKEKLELLGKNSIVLKNAKKMCIRDRGKHCGQIFTCVVNTWRGSGHFKKGKG